LWARAVPQRADGNGRDETAVLVLDDRHEHRDVACGSGGSGVSVATTAGGGQGHRASRTGVRHERHSPVVTVTNERAAAPHGDLQAPIARDSHM
jgi:hypothetical protein